MSRFFFALWPDKSIRESILNCGLNFDLSGQITDQSKLHITLLFLGKLTINQQQNIIRQAGQIICPKFEICLDHTGYFNNSKVVWLGLKTIPAALADLYEQLSRAAEQCEIAIKQQRYIPHLTLARKSSPVKEPSISAIIWHITDFVLVESVDTAKGVQYRRIKLFSCE